MGGNSIDVGIEDDFGWVWEITTETITNGKVRIQLFYWSQGVPHAKASGQFEIAQNHHAQLPCKWRKSSYAHNGRVLL